MTPNTTSVGVRLRFEEIMIDGIPLIEMMPERVNKGTIYEHIPFAVCLVLAKRTFSRVSYFDF